MNIALSTKAKTLLDLATVMRSAKILPMVTFSAQAYATQKQAIIDTCLATFETDMIVRSSSSHEDTSLKSQAGVFESILHVKQNAADLDDAIGKVIASYGTDILESDEVFVQPMLQNVSLCGVVFTADLDTLAPYYCINYDETGSTNSVTGGAGIELKTWIAYKNLDTIHDPKFKKIIVAAQECEAIFNAQCLDIEFACVGEELYILQVRAIVKEGKEDLSSIALADSLEKLYKKIKKLNTPHPKLLGSKTIFGVMPDWNPAEIIGIKPKRLALSLYKEMVTDEIWAYQRDNYGYRNLRSFPLLVSFLGVPYIDVRVSFNSFIPKKLHDSIASKLVEHYLEELTCNASHHDKVEFEIVYSCYFFGVDKKLQKLKKKNFTDNEIKRIEFELLELTNHIIDTKGGLYRQDLAKIEQLKIKYDEIINSELSLVDKIYWLIEDCKRYGTLPFAGIARAAFIAVQFLNSFVDEHILTQEEKIHFLSTIQTVSKTMSHDRHRMDKETFLKYYGHLRPGTYDICSSRYDEAYDAYFIGYESLPSNEGFSFNDTQKNHISKLLVESGIKSTCEDLLMFIKEAIEGREYAKFVFTKHLSKVLQLIEAFGVKLDIKRHDLAYLDIQRIKDLYSTLDHRDVKDIFESDIEKNKAYYTFTKAVKLPSLIMDEKHIYSFDVAQEEANFVTLNSVTAHVVDIEIQENSEYSGKIVCIKSADPGYDYLFSQNIAGLITCYGGANSHMAIRCAELGIPAMIGCGEQRFEYCKKANVLLLDAQNKYVKIIS